MTVNWLIAFRKSIVTIDTVFMFYSYVSDKARERRGGTDREAMTQKRSLINSGTYFLVINSARISFHGDRNARNVVWFEHREIVKR